MTKELMERCERMVKGLASKEQVRNVKQSLKQAIGGRMNPTDDADKAPQQQQQQIMPRSSGTHENHKRISNQPAKLKDNAATNPSPTQARAVTQSAEANPWCLEPMYRHLGQTAKDWCLRFYDTHVNAAYSDQDLSKIIDDIRGVDKEVQWLINTRQNAITAWQALGCTVAGMQKTIAQAAEVAYRVRCNPTFHADYGISLVNQIKECYD